MTNEWMKTIVAMTAAVLALGCHANPPTPADPLASFQPVMPTVTGPIVCRTHGPYPPNLLEQSKLSRGAMIYVGRLGDGNRDTNIEIIADSANRIITYGERRGVKPTVVISIDFRSGKGFVGNQGTGQDSVIDGSANAVANLRVLDRPLDRGSAVIAACRGTHERAP